MALTTQERTDIIKLVVAMFNAAPGATYLSDLTVAYEANGRSLSNLAKDLSGTAAYRALNPVFQTASEFATALLTPFGLQANTTAIDFVTAKFNAGVTKGQIALDVAVALNATTATEFADAKAILNNKTAVAEYYTVTKGISQTNVSTLQQAISTVTKDAASVTTANAAIDNGGSGVSGTSFVLATTADNLTGTSGNDTFNGVAGTGATFSAADLINGGSGVDTLSIVTDANFTLLGSNLTSIERIQANATTAAVVTFSNVSGVTELVNNSSSADLTFGVAAATAGAVNNVVNLSINGATAGTIVSYSDTALAGTADAMTLNLTGAGTAAAPVAVTIRQNTNAPVANQLETLSIVTNSASGITLTTDATQTSLKTVNVSGAGNLTLRLANDNIRTSATTINASTATGNVSIGADGTGQTLGAANHTVTLGAGNDSVFFGANLNVSDTVDGGAGTDTLGVSAAVSNAIMTNVKGFEVVRFDVSGADITQDAGITSLAGLNYAVTGANVLTLNNVASAITTTIVGTTTTLTQVLKDSSGLSDALNIGFQATGAATLTTLTNIAGLETLNLSTGTGTATHVITNDNVTAAHVITGAANLTITNALAATSINATAMTGKLTATAGNTGTNFQLGTAADTVTLGTGADTVNAGTGNDTINFGSTGITAFGADVVAGGAGNDIFNFSATAGATGGSTTYAAFATITDFTVGTSTSATDFLQFSAADTNFGATGAGGAATGLSKGATAAGLTAADAMVVQSVAKDAAAAALTANVSLIKLTTGVAFTTDIFTTAKAAIGTASVTGLAANGVYLVSMFDTTNNKAVFFTANTGTSANNDTALSTADFATGAAVHVVGVVNMTATDYAAFSAVNLAAASA